MDPGFRQDDTSYNNRFIMPDNFELLYTVRGLAHAFPRASRHRPSFSCTTRSEKLNRTASLVARCVWVIQLGTTKMSCGSQRRTVSPIRVSPRPSTATKTVPSVER